MKIRLSKTKAALSGLFLFLVGVAFWIAKKTPSAVPRTLRDIITLAKKKGLRWRGDGPDGQKVEYKIVLAKRPLAPKDFHAPLARRDWQGVVAVYYEPGDNSSRLSEAVAADAVVWGPFLLFGDQELIKEIKEAFR